MGLLQKGEPSSRQALREREAHAQTHTHKHMYAVARTLEDVNVNVRLWERCNEILRCHNVLNNGC